MPYVKSTFPELIDIKITDYCDAGCAFCYQGSTTEGRHADVGLVNDLAYELSRWNVFEVAIGGGEPTDHPNFVHILENFRQNNVIPNFTTKSLKWLDSKFSVRIVKAMGGFAYSVDAPEDITRLSKAVEDFKDERDVTGVSKRIALHYVMGSTDFKTLTKILSKAAESYMSVTLLGYKTNERGAIFTPNPYIQDILNYFRTANTRKSVPTISIDTKLAQQIGSTLIQEKLVPPGLITWEEGKFSMYIDAVKKRFGPSSYCEDSQMTPMQLSFSNSVDMAHMLEVYKTY